MEQAEIFHIVAIVSFAVSGLCLLLAAVSWFKLGIPEVIGDITGRTARKQIEEYEAKQEGRKERTRRKGGAAKSVRTAALPFPYILFRSFQDALKIFLPCGYMIRL